MKRDCCDNSLVDTQERMMNHWQRKSGFPKLWTYLNAGLLSIAVLCQGLLMVNNSHADELDARVMQFLEAKKDTWRDLNVPAVDGRQLYDLIVKRGLRQAFEIGTSTGHSTIWIAWALSKTDGKLITVEIDPRRQEIARKNIEAAGLEAYVEFILGDAHVITPAQSGPFDFVFSDADKDWYVQYFKDLYPKLTGDACFTAHNIGTFSTRSWVRDYLQYVRSIPDMETTVEDSGSGLAITCKK
jgi:predicted O-methyltransferase YrrM